MADVLIKRGVSGLPGVAREGQVGNYPWEAVRVAKILRAEGVSVAFEDEKPERNYLTYDAAEFWLPVLEFAKNVSAGVMAGVLVELVKSYVTRKPEESPAPEAAPTLHLEVTREGDTTKVVLDGPPDAVIAAIKEIERWDEGRGRGQLPGA